MPLTNLHVYGNMCFCVSVVSAYGMSTRTWFSIKWTKYQRLLKMKTLHKLLIIQELGVKLL